VIDEMEWRAWRRFADFSQSDRQVATAPAAISVLFDLLGVSAAVNSPGKREKWQQKQWEQRF
jgi:hypothetical protein